METTETQLNIAFEGERLRDEGIKRAIDHADRVEENWQGRAFSIFQSYARSHDTFATEDVRSYALETGFPDAPDPRAWGAVAMKAVRSGLIKPSHFELAKGKSQHRTPIRVWKAI